MHLPAQFNPGQMTIDLLSGKYKAATPMGQQAQANINKGQIFDKSTLTGIPRLLVGQNLGSGAERSFDNFFGGPKTTMVAPTPQMQQNPLFAQMLSAYQPQ